MPSRRDLRDTVARLASTIAFGGGTAAVVTLLGTRDLESYEHALFSLDRGTAVHAVHAFGQPVYTLAIGLGTRLPLHGSLGASPAALLGPLLPAPLLYWLLVAGAITAAAMLVRQVLEPMGGRLVSWSALTLLFCSPPIVNYTIYDDWPETAVTYCAFIGCTFAPHALLALRSGTRASRLLGRASIAAIVWGLIAASHPGYWPLLAITLIAAAALTLARCDHPMRTRLAAVAVLAVVSSSAVGLQAADILHEVQVAGSATVGMTRFSQGPEGSLISANAFPGGPINSRGPYTYLILAVLALGVGLSLTNASVRRLAVGGAAISMAFGVGASTIPRGLFTYSPTAIWGLRDPAIAFAVLSGACAAGAARRWSPGQSWMKAAALTVFAVAGLQGPLYAIQLVRVGFPEWQTRDAWMLDMRGAPDRLFARGFASGNTPAGARVALWPGVHDRMRNMHRASTDFADAGYVLVTAWTKQRTMRQLVEPNPVLFDQQVQLPPRILCDEAAVVFLQLTFLLVPRDVQCEPWEPLGGMLVDGWLEVRAARERNDSRLRSLPADAISAGTLGEPALSAGSTLLSRLVPLSGTSLRIDGSTVIVALDDTALPAGHLLVLPVAYDPAWRASAGVTQNVGGLLGLAGVDRARATLEFVPDVSQRMRAATMAFSQLLAIAGLLGLAVVGRTRMDS